MIMALISLRQPSDYTQMKHLHREGTPLKVTRPNSPHARMHALHGKTEEKDPASWKVSYDKNYCKGWQTKSHKLASPVFQTPPLAHLAELKYFQSLLCATTVAPMAPFFFKYSSSIA